MQSPTRPVSRRKLVCHACRARKKRCDGGRPRCDSCQKWDQPCYYAATTPSDSGGAWYQHPDRVPGAWAPPAARRRAQQAPQDDYFAVQSMAEWPPLMTPLLTPPAAPAIPDEALLEDIPSLTFDDALSFSSLSWPCSRLPSVSLDSPAPASSLPAQPDLVRLVDLFFAHFHPFVPCLHEASFRDSFCSSPIQGDAPALVYAVLAVAACMHTDAAVRQRQDEWLTRAKALYRENCNEQSVQMVQTALCLAFHALVTGDLQALWMLLGDSWRKACLMGFNRLDAPDHPGLKPFAPAPQDAREKEQRRRIFWTIFLLDRGTSFPCGLPYAIDDRQFLVNLPVRENIFAGTGPLNPEEAGSVPFNHKLSSLISARPAQGDAAPIMHHLIKAYVIMGRIVEHTHSIHPQQSDHSRYNELDSALVRFRLSLPRCATELSRAAPCALKYVLWLGMILHANTVLLHFTPTNSSTNEEDQDSSRAFEYCLAAARAIVQLVKDASRIATDTLANPHISPALYLASRILLIQWHRDKDPQLRDDIDLILLAFDRIADAFPVLAQKFTTRINSDVLLDAESIRALRAAGARGLLVQCSSWNRR
ncbi:F-actin capping protein beta subunit [Lasiodiplodia theobromae]|uniref:Zn(2)-C6 fungal-type domain-containing protein n=1 Tax=Lasiodiplodia theobromae TaxID=45133 RepID=A0A5N5D7S2_9PEZI|nr:F-actin capping protein beta subunit [Lasiodiplodia theobromae]KAB2573390.1 hypothetical protein DBV05_g7947 [Lasiodiplodia theobromae]KAF4546138.1 F-actin capping protein beta subunit [Lasiodiplodia theobromae]